MNDSFLNFQLIQFYQFKEKLIFRSGSQQKLIKLIFCPFNFLFKRKVSQQKRIFCALFP